MAVEMTRKTLLALAVAAATTSAHAVVENKTVDVQGTDRIQETSFHAGSLTLTGTAKRGDGQDGIDFEGLHVNGDFINNATFNLTGTDVDAIGADSLNVGTSNNIGGNFKHNGQINAIGQGAAGIQFTDTKFGTSATAGSDAAGNVIINGGISITDTSGKVAVEAQAGLRLQHTDVFGDLHVTKNGNINVQGTGAYGIFVDGTATGNLVEGKYSRITGDVMNDGSISASGADVVGLGLTYVGFSHDVQNAGTIAVNGANAVGIKLDQTNYNMVDNSGTIEALGADSIGILIRESLDANVMADIEANGVNALGEYAKGGIHNTGNITAEGAGIQVTNDLMKIELGQTSNNKNVYHVVHSAGLIKASIAIDGNGQTNLYLRGGDIEGNLDGIRTVFAQGKSSVTASEIVASKAIVTGELTLKDHTKFIGLNQFDALVEVQKGGTLALYVTDKHNPSAALVRIEGDFVLREGSTLGVTTTKGAFTQEAQTFTLVSAKSVTDEGGSIKALNSLLKVENVSVGATDILADISLNNAADVMAGVNVGGQAQGAARAFLDSILPNLDSNSALYNRLMNASDEELASLLSTLAPNNNGSNYAGALAAGNLSHTALNSRAYSVGANSGEALADTGAWFQILSGTSDQGTRSGVAGYDSRSKGFVVGADGKVNEQTTLGVAFAHVQTDVSGTGNKTDVKNNMLSVYGAWDQGDLTVYGSAGYAFGSNDSTRYAIGEKNKGSYDTRSLSLDVNAGYNIVLNDELTVTPTVGTRYANVSIDGFKEKGGATALDMGSQKIELFEVGAGVKVSGNYGDFKPRASLMAYHDFAQDNGNSTSAYIMGGNSFVTTGAPTTKWTYEAGVGLDWTKGNYTIGASYDYTKKADFNANTFKLTGRYDF